MSQDNRSINPDDFFADTRMSFGDHIEELRRHLIKAGLGFALALVFSFFIGKPVLRFISRPVEKELKAFYDRRLATIQAQLDAGIQLEENQTTKWIQIEVPASQFAGGEKPKQIPKPPPNNPETKKSPIEVIRLWIRYPEPVRAQMAVRKAESILGRRPGGLSALSVTEGFMSFVKVSIVCGLLIGSPWILYQLWSFVAVGLYPEEKRMVHYFVPFSVVLFLGGATMCQFLVIPKAIHALLWFNEWLDLEPDLRFSEWLSFAMWLPLIFGLAFQTPIVVMMLARVGIVPTEVIKGKRRIIWFVMAILSAMITPQDIYSMLFLFVPLCLLLELGIFLADRATARAKLAETEENKDLIEV